MKIISAVLIDPDKGPAMLRENAKELDVSEPAAGPSMGEGLAELFIVGKLGIASAPAKALRNTNVI